MFAAFWKVVKGKEAVGVSRSRSIRLRNDCEFFFSFE